MERAAGVEGAGREGFAAVSPSITPAGPKGSGDGSLGSEDESRAGGIRMGLVS